MIKKAPRGSRRWFRICSIVFLEVIFGCLLLELGVLVIFGEQVKFPRHVVGAPWELRYNQPGAKYRHKSADVTVYFNINQQGMRSDTDYSYEKTEGMKRIVSLGDSFTIGYEVDEDRCFSRLIETELRKQGHRVEVLNAGVSGFSSAEECLYFEKELVKYDPDLVIISFYHNDLVDNIRSNLFKLDKDHLVEADLGYIPLGEFANFLNTNWLFSWLSGYSNAFTLIKYQITLWVKQKMFDWNSKNIESMTTESGNNKSFSYEQKLLGAIYNRLYHFLREREIPFIIQSIPKQVYQSGSPRKDWPLVDFFPLKAFDVSRSGVYYSSAKEVLDPHIGKELLYWERSHLHWTPFSHEKAAKQLTQLIQNNRLMGEPMGSSD